MSLGSRLTILFSTLALIPLIFVSYLGYSEQRRALLELTINQLVSLAEVQEIRVNEKLDRYLEQANLVTSRTQLRISLANYLETSDESELIRVKKIILDAKNSVSSINEISVLDLEGNVIASTNDSRIGSNHINDKFFISGKETRSLTDIFKDDNNILNVQLSSPFVLGGELIGVAEIHADADPIISITSDYTGLGETGEILIAKPNTSGDALFASPLRFDSGGALNRAVPKNRINVPMNSALRGDEKVFISENTVDYRGHKVFAVSRFIDSLEWGLVVKIDRSEALSTVNSLAKAYFSIISLSIFLIVIFSILSIKAITEPIKSLIVFAQNLQSGNFSMRTNLKSDDEIGFLAATLNTMASKLQGLYRNLENKVKERTAQLEEAKVKDEAILGNIGDGLVFVDVDFNITLFNSAAEEILGFKESEILGKNWINLVKVSDKNGTRVPKKNLPVSKVLMGGKGNKLTTMSTTTTESYFYKKKDGDLVPVTITASRVEHQGNILGAVVVFRDATIEKQIDTMKTEFVSIASHQLRTPLTSIKLFVEMLLKGNAGKITKKQKDYLGDVSFSTERMIKLVNDLLNVSRIETGRLKIEPTPTDLEELVSNIAEDAKPLCKDKNCAINYNTEGDGFDGVNIDKSLMTQVVHNFVTNAIRYSKENGTIDINLSNKEKEYEIFVKDDGIGIPEEAKEKIFKKFYRADNAQKAEASGSGLGMYVAKMIVDAYGGRVWFDSEVDKGTTFYVTIPKTGMKHKAGEKGLKT